MPGGLAGRGGPLPPGYRRAGPGDTVLHSDLTGYYTWDFPTPAAPVAAAPAPVPSAVGEAAPAAGNGAISNTPIPISWGQRRIVGKVIDHLVKPLGADGIGAEVLDVCAGEPLFKDRSNDLVKIVADGTTIYDTSQGGVIHPGLTSVVWYNGCDDDQIADPTFAGVYGADVTPGYVGLMHAILDFNSYAAWNGTRPGITLFITDSPGGFETFLPWGEVSAGTGGTLDPDECSVDITLTGGDLVAERTSGGIAWRAVRGTIGRPANQSLGNGWFVFEITNDVANIFVNAPGPGLATEEYDIEAGTAGNGQSLVSLPLGHVNYNGGGSGPLDAFDFSKGSGTRWMIAVRLDVMKMWEGVNSAGWNVGNPAYDPINNVGGYDISFMSGHTIYPAWFSSQVGQKSTFTFGAPFVHNPPGFDTEPTVSGMTNWGDVFVALADHANLDPAYIVPIDITEESEGGVIYDGFSWTDVVSNAGKISNIDWWEDGRNIYVKQTALDNPPTDVDGIPAAHRYVLDEDQGSSEAERGGERRKPSVFELSYYDVSRQFQQSMVPARSEAHKSVTVQKLSVPWVMTAEAAATRSAIALGKSEMEMEEHKLSLPPTVPYFRLRPVDIVEFDEQERGFRTKLRSWTLGSDWGVEVTLQKLFTTATDPTVPLDLEAIVAAMPAHVPWRMRFNDRNNSGNVAAISGQ